MRLCECGCGGEIIPTPKHKYREPRFLNGHRPARIAERYTPRPDEIPSGICECGCGERTSIATATFRAKRRFRGHPMPFLPSHHVPRRGAESHKWKGGRYVHTDGHVYVYAPEHPAANARGYVFEHRLVMEKELGRLLEPWEIVHHRNEDKADNRPENLAVMTQAEHMREHVAGYLAAMTPAELSARGRAARAARL